MKTIALTICFVASMVWGIFERSQCVEITDQVIFAAMALLFIILGKEQSK